VSGSRTQLCAACPWQTRARLALFGWLSWKPLQNN